jgi:serine/threonine-protein kinase
LDEGTERALIGTTIDGRYLLHEVIGRGSTGVVFRATRPGVATELALKLLRRDVLADQRTLHRFQREAAIISRLSHPHTLQLYDRGSTKDGGLYIVTQLLTGHTLGQLMADGPIDIERALSIVEQICGSLAEAHSLGVVHRDLKPDNVFLIRQRDSTEDFVKVLDFGIAKRLLSARTTYEGTVVGTPLYMSPEQSMERPVDNRSDLYSLGAMLYHMLAGRPPFDGTGPLEVLLKQATHEPPPMWKRGHTPAHPAAAGVEALVLCMMQKAQDDRPQDAETVAKVSRELRRLRGRASAR